jgi:quercetin dioxygenase-like cupin family protein
MRACNFAYVAVLIGLILRIGSNVDAEDRLPFRVEIDNPAVQVIKLRLEAHASIPMHDLTDRVVVFLTDAHMRLTFPDGRTQEQHYRRGDTVWMASQRHAGENLGDHAIEMVSVIPKGERARS